MMKSQPIIVSRVALLALFLTSSCLLVGLEAKKLHRPASAAAATVYNTPSKARDPTLSSKSPSPTAPRTPVAPASGIPSLAPSATPSAAPSPVKHNNSSNPTAAPAAPSGAPSASPSHMPAAIASPTTAAPAAAAPVAPPTAAPAEHSVPTASPTSDRHRRHHHDDDDEKKKHHLSFWKILGRTIAWLILILLSVVAFGAIMSHRYRIYYFLRGCWYTLLRLDCTVWLLTKLRLSPTRSSGGVDSSLNTILFDNEMSEGLLMRESYE